MTMKPTKRVRILMLLLIPQLAVWIINPVSRSFTRSRIQETTTHHPPARLRLIRQGIVGILALSQAERQNFQEITERFKDW